MGFGSDQLRDKALAAVEEAATDSKAGALRRTKALGFSLAYLWAYAGGERWPFVNFWQAISDSNDIGRSQCVNASMNAIYRVLGIERPSQEG